MVELTDTNVASSVRSYRCGSSVKASTRKYPLYGSMSRSRGEVGEHKDSDIIINYIHIYIYIYIRSNSVSPRDVTLTCINHTYMYTLIGVQSRNCTYISLLLHILTSKITRSVLSSCAP